MAFADRIVAALEARGIEVIIDRRDLPLLEEWQRELIGFIQKADAVVFLVSPASVQSKWCEWKIGQVLAASKRLAPIVIEPVPASLAVPEAIAKINFIFFTSPDEFDQQANKLARALNSDIGWLKEHTRLGELARRWNEHQRSSSLLLRGQDVSDAEQWLIRQPREAPRPTELHGAYILTSRKVATRRQRLTLLGSVAATVVLAILAGVAFWQRRLATTALGDSRSRELTLLGEANIINDPQLTLNFAIAATEAAMSVEGGNLKLASSLLRRAVLATPNRLNSELSRVEAFAIRPGKASIAVATQDAGVAELSFENGSILHRFPTSGWVDTVDWSSDGTLLCAGSRDNTVHIWDGSTGQVLEVLTMRNAPQSVHWRKGTRQLAIALANANDSITQIYDLDARKFLFEVPGIRAAWSPDGSLLATGGGDGRVHIATATGQLLASLPGHDRYVHKVVWHPDGRLFATASVDDRVMVWDARDLRRIVSLANKFALSAAWSPDGRTLANGSGDRLVKAWETGSFELIFEIADTQTITGEKIVSGAAGYILEVAWSSNGDWLILSDRQKGLLIYSSLLIRAKSNADWLAAARKLPRRTAQTRR
jgi:hypothetical protein